MVQKAIYMDQVPDHYFFVGNPGTGKSEAIRVMGKVFHELGLLAKGHVITCTQADLVGEGVETTVQKNTNGLRKSTGWCVGSRCCS